MQNIESLKGIGEKTAKLFAKVGVFTVDDLLEYYPRGYDSYDVPSAIRDLKFDTIMSVAGALKCPATVKRFNKVQVTTAELVDSTGRIELIWFNMPFLKATLRTGQTYVFRGRVVNKSKRQNVLHLVIEQPEIFSSADYEKVINSMQPVYGQTKGLKNKLIIRAVKQALDQRAIQKEHLPNDIREKYELAEYNFAVEHIHFPKDKKDLMFARKRLVFDEFFFFILAVRRMREQRVQKENYHILKVTDQLCEIEKNLPFSLTNAQKKVLKEIQTDLSGAYVMNRLVQGDVGSGKTILAFLALIQAALNGCQGALMAPTEVLAKQHYESFVQFITEQKLEIHPVMITGSMTAKEKRTAYEEIKNHEADIIIGTHALIQEKVFYDNLALVITDEQHRFGVGQRETFGHKGILPHILVMSATPIPRTLAIILYGDLDISIVDELPANRIPIKNCVVNKSFRPKAYDFITKELKKGRQAYVICPMVEESEMIDAENVMDYTKILKQNIPSEFCVEYLHGKMKGKEKKAIMEQFAANQIQVLVSTTVIEVGINVPNATVIMIENAERFGLAQLHQLRGRVGRGKEQSYCIMVNGSDHDGQIERLEVLNKSNDGFFIASEDLKLRGSGDLFGFRQSGDMEFKLADIFTDADLLKNVKEEVDQILEKDPFLETEEHKELKKKIEKFIENSCEDINL